MTRKLYFVNVIYNTGVRQYYNIDDQGGARRAESTNTFTKELRGEAREVNNLNRLLGAQHIPEIAAEVLEGRGVLAKT